MHIPVDTRVNLVATTADVIHSFWVPALNRKIDTIPGQRNRILLYANKAGVYRGQCAEFCGLQHAHMGMLVFVQPKAQFRAWLKRQAAPAAAPETALERRGEQVFLNGAVLELPHDPRHAARAATSAPTSRTSRAARRSPA